MVPPLTNSLKAEETIFQLFSQIQKHLLMINGNSDVFSYSFQTAQGTQLLQTSGFVARMGNLCGKLTVCLPLAYPSAINKCFY